MEPSPLSSFGYSKPRDILACDPFVANLQPAAFIKIDPVGFATPSVRENHVISSTKSLKSIPPPRTSVAAAAFSAPPYDSKNAASSAQWAVAATQHDQWGMRLPDSPPAISDSNQSFADVDMVLSTSPPPSIKVQMMVDAYATPPTARTLPTKSSLAPSHQMVKSSSSSLGHVPAPIQTTHLTAIVAPLTPPLTPPVAPLPVLAPAPLQFATHSQRLLHDYDLHPIFAREYALHDELGCGGFGFVVRATRLADGQSVAVKFIEREKIPVHGWATTSTKVWTRPTRGRVSVTREGRLRIPMEAYVLGAIDLEGVVAFIDLFEDSKYFYLVMEHHGSPWQKPSPPPPTPPPSIKRPALGSSLSFTAMSPTASPDLFATPTSSPMGVSPSMPGTSLSPPRPAPMMRRSSCDLFECIEQNQRFDERTARYVFAQIVEVVYALSLMGICHRDIKDENIVISNDLKVKLIDFGSAVIFDPSKPLPVYDRFYGTTAFASAEILRGQPYEAPSSEVWSLGVLLSILLTGECPFADARAAAEARLSPRRVRIGFDVEALMLSCLEVDPTKRITIAEVRRHRWLRGALPPSMSVTRRA